MAEKIHVKKLMDDNPGVVSLEYPIEIEQVVQETLVAWRAFLALPQETKDILKSSNSHDGVGYEQKIGHGESKDIKENFDITQEGIVSLIDTAEKAGAPSSIRRLLTNAALLAGALKPLQRAYGQHMSDTIRDHGAFSDIVHASLSNVFIRLLSYPTTPIGTEIGEAHTDHSGFTIHLAETCGGCEALSRDGNWQALPIEEGRSTAFGSMQTQLATRGAIKALCHRIIATEETSRKGRLAIVAFTPLKGVQVYDRHTQGRLQEKVPGFNYAIDDDKFERMFQ